MSLPPASAPPVIQDTPEPALAQNPINLIASSLSALFVLYLLISANFLAELYGCRLQALLRSSMLMKHVLGIMTLLFFGVMADPTIADRPVLHALAVGVAMYAIFIMTIRTHLKVMLAVLCMLLGIYLLSLYRKRRDATQRDSSHIQMAQVILVALAGAVTLGGFVAYAMDKQSEYGNQFDWGTFILGKPACRGNDLPSRRVVR
jgi:hypothetical protein